VLRYFFSKDVRFGCWVLGVCVSFWSLLSMIQSRLLWRYGDAFCFLFSLGFGSEFRRSSVYALWGLPRNLYTLTITHYFFGSSSVLRTESTFLQGFEIQAKQRGARIKKNTQEVSYCELHSSLSRP
jgi:hypothetical protein